MKLYYIMQYGIGYTYIMPNKGPFAAEQVLWLHSCW